MEDQGFTRRTALSAKRRRRLASAAWLVPAALVLLSTIAISLAAETSDVEQAASSGLLRADALVWLRIAERLGVPVALGVALLCLLARLIRRLADALVKLIETLAANDSKHVEAIQTCNLGHVLTHEKLDKLHHDVNALRDRRQREHDDDEG